MPDELTAEQKDYENGIRIFARWIARAYLKDKAGQNPEINPKEKEENDANQRCK